MCLCGYPPDDFLLLHGFIEKAEEKLQGDRESLIRSYGCSRFPKEAEGGLKTLGNSAAIIPDGVLLGYQDKALLAHL